MQPDDALETMLRQRRFEAPSSNLAERIAMAARPVALPNPWWGMLSELLLPKPAFALALTLAVGFAAGMEAPAPDDATGDAVGDFLSYEGDVL